MTSASPLSASHRVDIKEGCLMSFVRAAAALLFIVAILPAHAEARTWTDCTGLHHFDGEIVSIGDESVLLNKPDKSQVRMEFDKLCHNDILYLRQYVHDHPRAGGPPDAIKN